MDSQEQLKSNLKNERHHNLEETHYWCDQYKMLAIKMEAELAALKAANVDLQLHFDTMKADYEALAKHRGE